MESATKHYVRALQENEYDDLELSEMQRGYLLAILHSGLVNSLE